MFRQQVSSSPQEALARLSNAINSSCVENDIWRRWQCRVDGHKFQVFAGSGFGLLSRYSHVIADGEVVKKEGGSEIAVRFTWGPFLRLSFVCLATLVAVLAVVALVMKKAAGAGLAVSLRIEGFLFAGYVFFFLLLMLPVWLLGRGAVIKALREISSVRVH